ncbi:MAG: hypothetical protein FWF79_04935 [Defluviitaleaceae bacterium]|nr:hypothetical protein [Defluviitaleaceae bacterium]
MFRKHVVEALDNFIQFALIYGLISVPVYLFRRDAGDLIRLALIAFIFIGCFIIRRLVKHLLPAVPVHLIFPVLAWLIVSEPFLRLIWVGAAIIIAAMSLGTYFRRGGFSGVGSVFLCAAVFIALSIWAAQGEYWVLVALYPSLLAASSIACVALVHMVQMDMSLEAVQLSSAQPVKGIISFNYRLVAGLSAGILVLTIIVYFAFAGPVLNFITSLSPQLPQLTRPAAYEDELQREQPMGRDWTDPYSALPFTPREPSAFARFVHLLLQIIITLVGIFGAGFFIFVIARAIFRRLSYRPYEYGITDKNADDTREFIFNRRKKAKPVYVRSDDSTRKLFRETINRHIKAGVVIKKSDTPTDMVKRIETEDISALARDYAKVRYVCKKR